MKVLHIEAGRHLYGGARQVGLLLDGLARAGVRSTLACPPEQPLAGIVTAADIVTMRIAGDLDLGLPARLGRLIRSVGPDVVHVHSRRGVDIFAGRAAARVGLPAVLTRRIESREPAAWARLKCRHYATVVAISNAVAAELTRAGIPEARVALIPSAVDTQSVRPDPAARARVRARYGLPADAVIVGMAAQFVPRKGHAFLFEWLPALAAREPHLRILLFGRGPLERAVARQVAARGLGGTVTLCGYAPDLPTLLPGLDVLLHPADREGLGSVVLEAMSAGCAVVAARSGGIVDAIEDGVSGILLPPRDGPAWLATVADLLHDPVRRAVLGRGARERVERGFTVARMTAGYLALYRRLTGHRYAA